MCQAYGPCHLNFNNNMSRAAVFNLSCMQQNESAEVEIMIVMRKGIRLFTQNNATSGILVFYD